MQSVVRLLPGLWDSSCGRKDGITRAAQGVSVCAAVLWLTSERAEMEGERKQVVEKVATLTRW